ncbi:hypothetical protein MN116_002549 [Schistosoma mekongi]|uniref:Peptidase M13 N-terminal domain-containing protein n=1 Tax=Schistosoma mekongi TaxID=38744 RepID=A0AAE1ZKE7_SCHME|nr:hypothetical protein MN116_002549 [Schistosoma mekongi]
MTFIISLLIASFGLTLTTITISIFALTNKQATNNTLNGLQLQNVCNDFYEVACSHWKEANPLSNETKSMTTFDQVEMNINKFFWRIISDNSYSTGDSRLQAARTFYKSCTDSRNLDTMRSTYYRLINEYFGEWEIIPSTLQRINITNGSVPNIDNMNLTDFYLPIVRQTGQSYLFSLSINAKRLAINIAPGSLPVDVNSNSTEFEQRYYRTASELGVPESEKRKLTDAFEMMQELTRNTDVSESFAYFGLRRYVTFAELNSICPQIKWSYVFEKVLQETGYVNYTNLPINIESEELLERRCTQYDLAAQRNKRLNLSLFFRFKVIQER